MPLPRCLACAVQVGVCSLLACSPEPGDLGSAARSSDAGAAGSAGAAGQADGAGGPAAGGGDAGSEPAAWDGGGRQADSGGAGRTGGAAGAGSLVEDSSAAGGGAASPPKPVTAVTPEPSDEASYLFDPARLRTYDILITREDLDSIDRNPAAEAWVAASLAFEGKTYGPYMVRYKGSVGSFAYPCTSGARGGPKTGKCSLKLGFNEIDPAGKFFGLRKLNFHSMQSDDSLLRERLGYGLFREMGLAAPRAVHARVLLNGQLEGVFALVEQVDGRFTRSRFGEGGEGNLYKEVWPIYDDPAIYLAALETNEDQQPTAAGMLGFRAAIDRGASAAASFLDRDYMLKYLAVDRVIINDDGIFHWWCDATAIGNNRGRAGNHNYYWYEALGGSRLWLLPWDLDKSFDSTPEVHLDPAWNVPGACTCNSDPDFGTQRPAQCDRLSQHFAAWQADYDRRVDAFLKGPFSTARVDAKLNAWTLQLRAAVIESAGLAFSPSEARWADAVISLSAKIDAARLHRGYDYRQ